MTEKDIKDLIEICVPSVTAVVANQDAPRPARPYAVFRFISDETFGLPVIEMSDDATDPNTHIKETVHGENIGHIQVDFFTATEQETATTARALCRTLLSTIYGTSSLELQRARGFSLLNFKDYSNIDEFLGNKWERRASCELEVHFRTSVSAEFPFIEVQPDTEIIGNYEE